MRTGLITRTTKETDIHVEVNLDGSGTFNVSTGIGFLDHMIEQFSRHSLIDVTLRVAGDLHVDAHHSVEDSAIALGQALDALRPLATQRGGKLWCVFGCGGDRDNTKRPMMGALAAQKADQVIVTSDNPRSEKPEAIIAQILLGMPPCIAVQVQSDRAQAIAQAITNAGVNDVILLAGKGHEATQEVAGQKIEFSDRTHAGAALALRKGAAV